MDDFYAITSQRSREYIRALPFRKKKSFRYLFPDANPLAVDLLEQLLTFSPKRRIDVEQALKHPYLAPYHDPQDEPTAEPLDPSFFSFDNGEQMRKEDLKGMRVPPRARRPSADPQSVLIYEEVTRPQPFQLSEEA